MISIQTEYQTVNGTSYNEKTNKKVIEILERARKEGLRLKFAFGDTITGRDWEETHGVTGYIGRSSGNIKVPILLNNRRSLGGAALLDHCIIKIEYANKKRGGILYMHPDYHKEFKIN
jgi:hypothetical protein